MRLSAAELELLERDGFVVSQQSFRQCFQPYLSEEEMPRFITSDSILNAFHRLVADSTRVVDELGVSRLQRALRAVWEGLGDGPPEALARARMLVGVALRLLGEELELGPEVDAEVERVCQAQGPHFPNWLSPATADFAGLDYARYKVRGFYTSTPALGRYFRAVTWLQSVPLRVELDLQAAWLLARAQDHETLDALRSSWQALAAPADWDLSLFTGRESWDEFCDRVADLAPPPALNDQLALMRAPNIRFLSARALPDSLFFLQHDATSLPDPRALCAALGSCLAGRTFSGEVGRVETDSRRLSRDAAVPVATAARERTGLYARGGLGAKELPDRCLRLGADAAHLGPARQGQLPDFGAARLSQAQGLRGAVARILPGPG